MRIHNTFLCTLLLGTMLLTLSCSDGDGNSDKTTESTAENIMSSETTDVPADDNKASFVIENRKEEKAFDIIRAFTLAEIGIGENYLFSFDNIEFTVEGERLPAVLIDDVYWIRVPEIAGNGKVTVNVTCGGDAKTEFDGRDVFEIVGGNPVYQNTPNARTAVTICKNGDLITGKCIDGGFYYERSTDGGLTWSESTEIPGLTYRVENGEWIKDSTGIYNKERRVANADLGGFISDTETGSLFVCINEYWQYTCMKLNEKGDVWLNGEGRSETDRERSEYGSVNHIWKSDDNGNSWEHVCSVRNGDDPNKPLYSLFYANGIVTPDRDGNGSGVDYIFAVSGSDDCADNLYNTSLYSCDNGITWQYSETKLTFDYGSTTLEGGLSEPSITALSDGRIVMIMRNQSAESVHFAVSYSANGGKTWSKPVLSEVFAPNTQPLLDSFGDYPILMWGGNNILGGTSYLRFPLSLAVLDADNAQNILSLYDLGIGSASFRQYGRSLLTNPAFLIFEREGKTKLLAMGGANCTGSVLINDLEDYLKRTKGAFDSFEEDLGSWVILPVRNGNANASTGSAQIKNSRSSSEGFNLMLVSENTTVSRSFGKSTANGTLFVNFAVTSGSGTVFELQTSLNDITGRNPYLSIVIEDDRTLTVNGIPSALAAKNGVNSLAVEFENTNHSVIITLNGNTFETSANTEYGELVSYFNVTTPDNTTCELDCFILIDND